MSKHKELQISTFQRTAMSRVQYYVIVYVLFTPYTVSIEPECRFNRYTIWFLIYVYFLYFIIYNKYKDTFYCVINVKPVLTNSSIQIVLYINLQSKDNSIQPLRQSCLRSDAGSTDPIIIIYILYCCCHLSPQLKRPYPFSAHCIYYFVNCNFCKQFNKKVSPYPLCHINCTGIQQSVIHYKKALRN